MDTVSDYGTIIIALTTILYTIGTFLLWKTTQESLKLARQQFEQTEKQRKIQIFSDLVLMHRNLFNFILSNDELRKALSKDFQGKSSELTKTFIGTFLINHTFQLYYQNKHENIDSEIWNGILMDIRDMFRWSIIKRRWDIVKAAHTPDFREFIEKKVLNKDEFT